MALAIYTYSKDMQSLFTRLVSAGVPASEVNTSTEVALSYDHILTDLELEELAQAMADAGWVLISSLERVPARSFELRAEMIAYLSSHYDSEVRQSLTIILSEARDTGLTDRATYAVAALTWVNTVLGYYYAKIAELEAALGDAALQAITWDFPASLDAADPLVTVQAAMGILT